MLFNFIPTNPSEILLFNFFSSKIIISYILNKPVFLKPTATSSLYIPDNGCRFGEFHKKQWYIWTEIYNFSGSSCHIYPAHSQSANVVTQNVQNSYWLLSFSPRIKFKKSFFWWKSNSFPARGGPQISSMAFTTSCCFGKPLCATVE
jgi:hypothetical protein